MRKSSYRTALALHIVLCSVFAIGTLAQEPQTEAPPLERQLILPDSDERITAARQLIRSKNYEGAAALLETIYESDPTNEIAANLLRSCYQELRYHDKLSLLLSQQAERNPHNLHYRLSLAETFLGQGKIEQARLEYEKLIQTITKGGQFELLIVIRSLIGHNQFDMALDYIQQQRTQTSNPQLYRLEEGIILEKQRRYRDAALIYLPLAAADSTPIGSDAERRLMAMLEFGESSLQVEQTLKENLAAVTGARTASLLVAYYLRDGRFEDAFAFAIRQDSLERAKGLALVSYIRQCIDRKAFPQAIRMAEYFSVSYPSNPMLNEVNLRHGQALAEVGRFDEAIAKLQLSFSSPNPQDKADAYLSIGTIYLNQMKLPDSAIAYFEKSIDASKRGLAFVNARRFIPIAHVRAGRLDKARSIWSEQLTQKLSEELLEEATWSIALVDFFEHKFDSAEIGMRRVVVTHPRGFFVNDCLRLLVVIADAKESPELLQKFADAERFMFQQEYDSARMAITGLIETENHILSPVALYELASLDVLLNDSSAAIGQIDRLTAEYPDSYYIPYGLKLKADLLAVNPLEREKAAVLYRQLLEKYPNFPYVSEVRKRLRQLQPTAVG